MNRYRIEVIEQVTHRLTLDAETAQEAVEAAQRHEGEARTSLNTKMAIWRA